MRLVTDLWRDVRYAVRGLRRSPTFAAAAVISIGLGVGANSLVFSVVNALVLKPLPVDSPDRVVFVQRSGSFVSHSFPFYRELRDRNVTFDGLAGYRITMMEVDAAARATHEWGYLVTGNYFDVLGVRPAAGRFFGPTDDVMPGASPYAVLSHDYWQARFGGDPSIVGATIRINRLPYTVLGVAPAGFYGTEIFYRPRIWVPMMMQAQIEVGNPWLENPNTANTWVVGRLRSDVSANAASDNLNAIAEQVAVESGRPSARQDAPIRLTRPGLIGDGLGGPARGFAFGVLALAILVLAIACANLASSLAARGKDRQRELAIRLSIGAGRGRIVRQLLTECLVLATAGAALGALVAWATARALSQWQLPTPLPLQLDVTPDLRVLAYTLMTAVATGIAFGVAPARQASLTSPVTALRAVDGATRRGWPIRDVLVGVQVALCFVLVATSMAAIQGLWSAMSMSMGMRPSNVTIATFDLGLAGYSETAGSELQKRALERLEALPSVVSAAYANSLPLNIDQSTSSVTPDDRPDLPGHELPSVVRYKVSPRFFETLGVRVLKGREFQWTDDAAARRVAIVNEAFARQILRTDDAVGRRFRLGVKGNWIEIVGMVETGKYRALTEPDTPALFDPILQAYSTTAAEGLLQYVVYPASSADVSILLVVAAPRAVVGLVACWPPVRRTLRQDPVRALYVE